MVFEEKYDKLMFIQTQSVFIPDMLNVADKL